MAELNGWLEPQSRAVVRDVYGRSYRLGPNDRVLLGYSRVWVAAAAWLVMLAVSGTQYGYGTFAARLTRSSGLGLDAVAWGFTLWITCHAVASGALPWLRRRYGLTSREVVTAGAVGCGLGLLAHSQAGNPVLALAGYGVACGLGTGLVYGACGRGGRLFAGADRLGSILPDRGGAGAPAAQARPAAHASRGGSAMRIQSPKDAQWDG